MLDDLSGLAPATADSVIAAARRLLTELGAGVEYDTALLALSVPGLSPAVPAGPAR